MHSKQQDKLKNIWREAFPEDPPEYIDYYFNTIPPEWFVTSGERAFLTLMPIALRLDEVEHPAGYIYAAATAASEREKGVMSALLEETLARAAAGGMAAVFLIPSDERLERYYSARGFGESFSLTELERPAPDVSSREEFIARRAEYVRQFPRRLELPESMLGFVFDNKALCFEDTKKIYGTDKTVCLCRRIDESLDLRGLYTNLLVD